MMPSAGFLFIALALLPVIVPGLLERPDDDTRFMQQREFPSVGQATVYGIGSGIGWWIAIVAVAAIREKLAYSNIPKPLRGVGITFIVTGLMGIAFMSFLGIKL